MDNIGRQIADFLCISACALIFNSKERSHTMKTPNKLTQLIFPLTVLLAGASVCQADTVYDLVPENVAGVISVTGTITTDGNTGVLSTGDILSWDLSLEGFGDPVETLTSAAGSVFVQGSLLDATATQLSWSFPGGVGAEFSLTPVPDNVITQWHLYTDRIDVDYNGTELVSRPGGSIVFATAAPDGGNTLMLLGAGFGTLAWFARRKGVALSPIA
jgi:hypothetical protein